MARRPTGADSVVSALEHLGVEVAFGLPGVHNLALWRALDESPIRLVGVRHEQAAAYAADGYARTKGTLGVALTTTGPGAANALGAVGEAWASRSPLLIIATDIPTTVRRPGVWRGALHEASDQAAMFAPVVKHAERVPRADALEAAVQRAARAAVEAPSRPAYLEVPTDLLSTPTLESRPSPWPPLDRVTPAEADVDRAVKLAEAARAPLIWAGGGAASSGAGAAVALLAERLAAPVITTYAGRGLLPPDHPCLVSVPPHVPEAGALWDEADLVISVGSDLDAMTTQAWKQPQPPAMLVINIDSADGSKNYRADVVLRSDATEGTTALAERIEARDGLDTLGERLAALNRDARSALSESDPEAMGFLGAIRDSLPAEAVLAVDMCIPGYWLGGFHQPAAPRQMLYPLGWGTLGCAFPQAIGAALAGDAPVVSISGDGGFLYAATELATVAQERIPLTAVIVDDGGYGMLRFDQEMHGDPHVGVDLHTPDFETLAGSFGVRSELVDGLGEEFGAAVARHVAMDEPSVLVARAALRPPPNVSPRFYRAKR